ncbi:hypothetical protein JDN40_06020 [Rhodomicrobium vannielii ATCC 17100]|uniref:hypothetical protein n=1 Tax=Rhodomicrobium vannielii TaxID=1069 RepID=UPI0019197BD7|nr:hypothetical protein [Rhodomicrobium vannielii]MBJ7533655.1 hypothetical protein [Rhodomicrobium vannielii ATCC 17100]
MEHEDRHALRKKGRIGETPTDLGVPVERSRTYGDTVVIADLPKRSSITRDEIGLLRAFLLSEINAILFEDEAGE